MGQRKFKEKIAREGTVVTRTAPALVRPGVVGEHIHTIIKGRVISFTQVESEDSWVIRGPVFKELYVLSGEKFRAAWEPNGEEIPSDGVDALLKAQNFLRHMPKSGNLRWIYQVTKEDLVHIPNGNFQGARESMQQVRL